MSYIEKNLLKNEKIIRCGHRHWVIFIFPLFWLVISLILLIPDIWTIKIDMMPVWLTQFLHEDILTEWIPKLVLVPLLLAIVTGISALLNYFVSEIALTNVRVIMKLGFIRRVTTEIPLRNVATIRLVQGLLGRLLNYGTVEICDVGNVCLIFRRLVFPVLFRSCVEEEMHKQPFRTGQTSG